MSIKQELKENLTSELSSYIQGVNDIKGQIKDKDFQEIKLCLDSALFFFDTDAIKSGITELNKALNILNGYSK